MIDYHDNVVTALENILPTYYELQVDSSTVTPCITYILRDDYCIKETFSNSGTVNYLAYTIKVWGNRINELQTFCMQIDTAMRALGFKRISTNELSDKNSLMIQKIMVFEAKYNE